MYDNFTQIILELIKGFTGLCYVLSAGFSFWKHESEWSSYIYLADV